MAMTNEGLVFAGVTDLAGKLRGKGFPLSDLEQRLKSGVGWVPTNAMITCFDTIGDGPYGSLGDLLIMPDPGSKAIDRKSVVEGKSVSVSVDLGSRRIITQKTIV